ncbi:hypothetical protein BH11ACT1_BH11ACT1_19300 [soil metagenome]
MNRAERRAARTRTPDEIVLNFAAAYACPDCGSENELTTDFPGVYRLTVRHDPTCPFLKGRTS